MGATAYTTGFLERYFGNNFLSYFNGKRIYTFLRVGDFRVVK